MLKQFFHFLNPLKRSAPTQPAHSPAINARLLQLNDVFTGLQPWLPTHTGQTPTQLKAAAKHNIIHHGATVKDATPQPLYFNVQCFMHNPCEQL